MLAFGIGCASFFLFRFSGRMSAKKPRMPLRYAWSAITLGNCVPRPVPYPLA